MDLAGSARQQARPSASSLTIKAIEAVTQAIIARPGNRKFLVSVLAAMTMTLVKLNPASNGEATVPIEVARAFRSATFPAKSLSLEKALTSPLHVAVVACTWNKSAPAS